jgi:hypothetical protein
MDFGLMLVELLIRDPFFLLFKHLQLDIFLRLAWHCGDYGRLMIQIVKSRTNLLMSPTLQR